MNDSAPPPPREIRDAEALKALAHGLRGRIHELLRQGPATSTTLARALGESTGATSYHLRQLARYGFIEEAPELSRGRERWWRSRLGRMDIRFPRRSQQSPELRAALGELEQLWHAADLEALARFQAQRDQMGEWGDALPYSRGAIQVNLSELEAFFEEYMALLKRYARAPEDASPGARRVLTRFLAFPEPEPPTPDSTDEPPPEEGPESPTT